MYAGMTEAEKAVLRDAKFNEWNKRKSIRDRIVNLLGQLAISHAEDEASCKEVGIAMCAAEFLLGEDSSKKVNKDAGPQRKTLKQVFYKWVTENYSFSMIRLSPEEVNKFSGAVKEMLYQEKDDDGVEFDVLLSLKYFFPAVPKPNEKSKPLTNDQSLQNAIFQKQFSKLWKWCREETKNRTVEYAQRCILKKKGGMNSETDEKSNKEANEKGESDSKSASEASSKAFSDRNTTSITFGGADGKTFTKYELLALQELSLTRLKLWIEEDEDLEIKAKKAAEEENANLARKIHGQFVKVKDSLRIRMPPQEFVKSEFPTAPKLSYGRELDGVKPKTFKGPQSTVEMMAGSGLKWVHATGKGRQGQDGDLEKSRKQLLSKGFVSKSNFDVNDEDGGEFDLSRYKKEITTNEKMIEKREGNRKLKEASAKAFNEWVQQKDLREQAVKCLAHVNGTKDVKNNTQNRSNSNSLRNSRENSIVEPSVRDSRDPSPSVRHSSTGNKKPDIPVRELIEIGRALKKVDRTLIGEWSTVCGKAIPFNTCAILWDSFEPISCDVHNPAYSAVRDSFLKLLRPGVDFRSVFKDFLRRKVLRQTGEDIDDMTESERKALHEEMALNKQEMMKVLTTLGIAMKAGELRVLIDAFDENGDGVVTLTEFMNFVGPKRDKRGGASLSLNQRCCWSTTCKVTGMPNAYSVSSIDRNTALARKASMKKSQSHSRTSYEGIAKESEADMKETDANGFGEIIELNNGEYRLRVELRERKRREDILRSYGIHVKANNEKSKKDKDKDGDYDDDFASPGPDEEAGYEDEFEPNEESAKKKDDDASNANRCSFVSWTMEQRLEGLQWLFEYTRVAREEAELNYILTHGEVPQLVELTSGRFGDRDVGTSENALCDELLLKWKPVSGDLVSFFSVEMGGQAGTGKEGTYHEICRDPPDASSDLAYCHWVRGLLPGATYNFRIRAFNGYGPSEYTYKSFTTRPGKPSIPKVIYLSSDAVTLRWIFSKGFTSRLNELRRIFDAADTDRSNNVSRNELAAVIDADTKLIGPELLIFLKSIASEYGIDPNEGFAALFDKIEGDDDEDISWEEFQRFFLNAGWMNATTTNGQNNTLRESTMSVSSSVSTSQTKQKSGVVAVPGGSSKAIKLTYCIEQCENELTDEYKEIIRITSGEGKGSIKHLNAGKSYRFRIVALNVDGVAGPASDSIVVHTLLDTPTMPIVSMIPWGNGKLKTTGTHGSTSSATSVINGTEKRPAIDATKITICWKDRNSQLFSNSREPKFVSRMLGDWTGSQGAGEAGARSVSIEAAFAYYDRDQSGSIDPTEFALLLEDLGVEPTPDRLTYAFSQLDSNHDGTISFEEFSTWWRQDDVSYTIKRSERILPKTRKNAVKVSDINTSKEKFTGLQQVPLTPMKPRQCTYPIIPYRIGPATKTEISGLSPNSLYQFVLRYVGSRSMSNLSKPLVVMSAPLPPRKPVLFLITSNSVRLKMYAGKHGTYKFVVQIKQQSNGRVQFALPTTPMTGGIDVDGWNTVYCGQETCFSCMTLASDTEYSIRIFGCNNQNCLSEPSEIATFRTPKRVVNENTMATSNTNNNVRTSMNSSLRKSRLPPSGSDRIGDKNSTIAKLVQNHSIKNKDVTNSMLNMSINSNNGGGSVRGSTRGQYNESVFTIECRYDMCVGDTILFTERLYLKQQRDGEIDVRTSVEDDIQSVAGSGSVKMTRVVNGKKVVRLDMSNRSHGEGSATGISMSGATVNMGHSNNNIMIGERVVAAHIIKDNYRTLKNTGHLDDSEFLKTQTNATTLSLDVIEKRKLKLCKNRRLTLEVIWSKASNVDCKKYELKRGDIVERAQDLNMISFDVYRCEWLEEPSRCSYEQERELLMDCFQEYE